MSMMSRLSRLGATSRKEWDELAWMERQEKVQGAEIDSLRSKFQDGVGFEWFGIRDLG